MTTYAHELTTGHIGHTLWSVNGVGFGGQNYSGLPGLRQGLVIEGVDSAYRLDPEDDFGLFTLVTVWMGPAMVGFVLNKDDEVVTTNRAH